MKMKKNSRIYLAGHRGLVGSAILRALKDQGYKNLLLRTHSELDLLRQRDVEIFFENERPDYVICAAAKVGGISANDTFPADFLYENLMISTNLIQAAYKNNVKKLLNLGSTCIYPRSAPQPLKEEYLLSGYLEPTNEAYAVAKIAAVKMCAFYNKQYGTDFLSVMPTNLYGPGDNYSLKTSHVLPAMIRKFHLAKLLMEGAIDAIAEDLKSQSDPRDIENELKKHGIYADRLILWGSGRPLREFLYSDDLADACLFLMKSFSGKDLGEIINIGFGRDLSIADLAEMVKDIVGFQGNIEWDASKPEGTPRKAVDTSRMESLGWRPSVDLKDGIRRTYDAYKKSLKRS